MHTFMLCSVDNELEIKLWAFSIRSAARDDLEPKLDVSAWLAMVSLPVNIVPFHGLKTLLATHMHAFIPQNDLLCRCSVCS